MDRTQEERQLQRVQEKLARMAESDPELLCLELPAEEELAAAFERERGTALPWDYRHIITQVGDGGRLPQRFWYTLPEAAERGDGELLLTGNGRLGWLLRIQGPFAGEVWTVCGQRLLRVPGCTFVQWLELELDEDLESYLGYCLTGKDTELTRDRDLLTLLETPPEWGEEDPAERCARWLEDNRFVHEGPSEQWTSYLKGHLSSALRPRPQERSQALIFRRQAQEDGSWQWDEETARRWERTGELARAVLERGREEVQLTLTPEEESLFRRAKELAFEKRFQARNMGIRSLSFLEGMTHLREVDLWDNDIEDLSPLASLTNLKELWVPFNRISDLSPLAGLERLSSLHVYGNRITSLEPLRGLSSLNSLDLRKNPLEPGSLACLRKCKRLGMLDLSDTGIQDIRDLEFCRAWSLDIYGNPGLTGLEVLSTMKRLSSLYLDTETARRYDIQALAPQLTEFVQWRGLSLYVWPEKYFN